MSLESNENGRRSEASAAGDQPLPEQQAAERASAGDAIDAGIDKGATVDRDAQDPAIGERDHDPSISEPSVPDNAGNRIGALPEGVPMPPGALLDPEAKKSKLEPLKEASRQLRGTIQEEMDEDIDHFSGDAIQLLKHHGSYQQDNRDLRNAKDADGNKLGKQYGMMIRSAIPGGKITAAQMLAEIELGDRFGDGTLRITSRQGLQQHGVLKDHLKDVIAAVNEIKLTTYAACGDVSRNVMCDPAPGRKAKAQMQEDSDRLAAHLRPKSTAYYELWLKDENGERTKVSEGISTDEAKAESEYDQANESIYGEVYLPRKFKIGIALPEDNSVDILTQDLGLLAIEENGEVVGYDVYVGGGMGNTPAKKETSPLLGQLLGYCDRSEICEVAEAVVKVQRDYGNRADRKQARLKYLIRFWGMDTFREQVERYLGRTIVPGKGAAIVDALDHGGWHEHGPSPENPDWAGKLWLGLTIQSGRILDRDGFRLKSALKTILSKYPVDGRLTAAQDYILVGIDPDAKDDIDAILVSHGITLPSDMTLTRRFAMSCVALPTCGLAVTESERIMTELIADLDASMAECGLAGERIVLHVTGCPNGCARPYTPEVGLVGKAKGRYTMYLGGSPAGTRLGFLYDDLVPLEEVVPRLKPLMTRYAAERNGESFGDWCDAHQSELLDAVAAA